MQFTIFTGNCTGAQSNCFYPDKRVITSADRLREAVAFDHVCAYYKNNYRSIENFLKSDVVVMDIDNDHTANPAEFITADKLDALFPDVDYCLVPSRNHNKAKGNLPAAPRFHVFFPIKECTDAKSYSGMKEKLHKAYPFFDGNALDAARFLFGCKASEVIWHEGWLSIENELESFIFENDTEPVEDFDESLPKGRIQEGSRNRAMSLFAGKVLKRYGNTEKAQEVYMEHSKRCDPPLEKEELETIWQSAVKFYTNKVASSKDYVAPDEYNDEFGDASMKPEDYSDIGEAKVLAKECGEELKSTSATDYLRFDGQCWREDKQMAVGATEEFLDLQLEDAKSAVESAEKALVSAGVAKDKVSAGGKALEKECTSEKLQKLMFALMGALSYKAFVMKCRNYKNLVNVQNAAKPMLPINVSALDKNPFLLNTPEATFDMSKGLAGRMNHDAKDLITKITEVSPGDEGADIWKEALELFFCGDSELIKYVQMTVGLAAIGKVYQEHMIIAYGGGANGKSTFWNTIYRVLGNYAGKISAEALTMNCKRNVKPEMAELKGKRLIIASEMEEGMRLNTATVKQLCSTDEIQAEKKYKDPFAFTPSRTLVLYTNHLPRVGANDDGIWRRLVVIPFNAKITGSSDIKNYADHLYLKAGPAIMKWIIEGAKAAIDADYRTREPQAVRDAIDAYREDNDWLGQFLDECCIIDKTLNTKSGDLYQAYRSYCVLNGEYTRSTTDFYSSIDKAGLDRHKTKKGYFVYGVGLKDGQDFLD